MPHLAVREEFHPKRNQARQKLATLPKTRFKDLASDVFFELERRFPELREEFRPEAVEQGAASREKPREVIAAQPSTADVVVPNKSKLVEEDVTVPYAKTLNRTKDGDNEEPPPGYDRDKGEGDRVSIRDSIVTADNDTDAFNRNTVYSQASSVGTGFFNGYAGSKATESIVASPHLGRSSENEASVLLCISSLFSDSACELMLCPADTTGLVDGIWDREDAIRLRVPHRHAAAACHRPRGRGQAGRLEQGGQHPEGRA